MNMFFTLLKTQLNNRFGLTAMRINAHSDKKAFRKQLGMSLVIIFSMIYLVAIYSFLAYKFFGLTLQANMPEIILVLTISASMIVTLLTGLIFILGSLFFAKDSEFLATLPVKPSVVFASKFSQVYLNEIFVTLAFLLPPFIIYGVSLGMGALFYLKALLIILFVPAIPLLISALLSMVLMNLVSRTRRRDTIAVVGSIALLILYVFGQTYLMSQIPENGNAQALIGLLNSQSGLINFLGRAFPPSAWATLALVNDNINGLFPLVEFICLSLILLIVTIPLAGKIYYKGALSHLETAKKNKKRSAKESKGQNSPVMAIFFREWKTITRSPIYALNSLSGIFMALIIMVLPMFGGSMKSDPQMNALLSLITGEYTVTVLLAFAGMMVLFGGLNPAASTVLSREGTSFWISKVIPVSYRTQIIGKFLFGYSIGAITAFATAIGAIIGLKISMSITAGALLLALLTLVSITAASIIIDLARPRFNWNSETEAIKQNMNVLASMLASVIIIGIYVGATWLMQTLAFSWTIIVLVDVVISVASGAFLYSFMLKYGEKRFGVIEP